MTAKDMREKKSQTHIQRSISLTRDHSRRIDEMARRLGIPYSAVVNLVLAGKLSMERD